MAEQVISDLSESTSASTSDLMLLGQGSALKKITFSNVLASFAGKALSLSTLTTTGQVSFGATRFEYQPTPDTVNTTSTLTAANLQKRILLSAPAASITLTLPTGATIETVGTIDNDRAFMFTIVNTSANAITVAENTGVTVTGSATVAANTSGTYNIRKTASSSFVAYRV